jgi:hypothetical protein
VWLEKSKMGTTNLLISGSVSASSGKITTITAYCSPTTKAATAVAESDDKHQAGLKMTDDCRIVRQTWG